ncbi:DUF2726 domain-containing protein [Sphingomonas oryzagri]
MSLHMVLPIVILIALIAIARNLRVSSGPPDPVMKRFLTQREEAILAALESELPWCRIHGQVAMGALLKAPEGRHPKYRYSDRNAFAQKIVDFVAQDRETGRIVALIEVDDRSHDAERDRARDRMTASAGYRTIRIPASARAGMSGVRSAVMEIAALRPGALREGSRVA